MNDTLTLSGAVAKAFSLRNVPEFNDAKPLKQAADYLNKNGVSAEFQRGELRPGVVVFHRGGNIMYTVVAKKGDDDVLVGASVIGTLVGKKAAKRAKNAKKSQKTAENAENNDEHVDESNVAPVNESTETAADDGTESE